MNNIELVCELTHEQPTGQHPMVVIDRTIYIIDGNKLVKLHVPKELFRDRLRRWLGFPKI